MRDSSVLPATGRIRLRPLGPADLPAHRRGEDAEIVRWQSGGIATAEEQRKFLVRAGRDWREGASKFDLGIETVAAGQLAGIVGLQSRMPYLCPTQVNVSYALYPEFRGRGLASEAVLLAAEVARRVFDVSQLIIRTDPRNDRSAAVARRLGFRLSHRTDDAHGVLDWYTAPLAALVPVTAPEPR